MGVIIGRFTPKGGGEVMQYFNVEISYLNFVRSWFSHIVLK